MATEEFFGPVDYLVFAFDQGADLGAGLHALLTQVANGTIEILDIEVITRDPATGKPSVGSLAELATATDVDLAVFDGAASGILDAEDLATVASGLGDTQFALVVIYEDRSLASAAEAWSRVGGIEVLSGGVDLADLDRILQEEDPA